MSWERLLTRHPGVGTLCEVHVDESRGLIKRLFRARAVTVSGKRTRFAEPEISTLFANEVYWLRRLSPEWTPELVEIDEKERVVIQRYHGATLLDYKPHLLTFIPDVVEQVLEMHRYFKNEGMFKGNGSLSNMTLRNGRVLAFDFKWATHRPEGLEKELFSYDNYLVKIDPTLPSRLREMI